MAQDSAIQQGKVEGKEAEDAGAGADTGDEAGTERTSVRSSTKSSSTRAAPACSGQAYFVADGQPCNPQEFLDGVLDGLGAAVE